MFDLRVATPLLAVLLVSVVTVCSGAGCKKLPNPETDEMVRAMRGLDRAHRPSGGDLPLERYFAWASARDAGLKPPADLDKELSVLVDEQRNLVDRLRKLETTSDDALAVLEAYLGAHLAGHQAMEEVLAGRRLGDTARARRGEAAVQKAMADLRAARTLRHEAETRMNAKPAR